MPKKPKKRMIKTSTGSSTKPLGIEYSTDNIEVFGLIKEGLPYESVENLVEQGIFSADEITYFIPTRTLARRKQSKKLSAEESDTIARLALVFDFAKDVFGSKEKAKAWLRHPNKALKGYAPIDLLATNYGTRMVETILGRIEHGVYS